MDIINILLDFNYILNLLEDFPSKVGTAEP
jgi:hypothetical protein